MYINFEKSISVVNMIIVSRMRASDVATLTVRAGAHSLANSARERGVQDVSVKLVVKHKDFTMQTLVSHFSNQLIK